MTLKLTVQKTGYLALLATGLLVSACSATNKADLLDDEAASSASSGKGGAGAANVGAGGEIVFAGTGGGDQVRGCSSDLQYVLDDNGVVLEDCWPDQGCSEGKCVEPCAAAAASQGNIGCEFKVATPHFYVGIKPPCFAMFLANAWPKDATISIERGGQSFSASTFGRIAQGNGSATSWQSVPATGVPPDEVAVLFLSHDPQSTNSTPLTCPIQPAISASQGSAVANSAIGEAWTIRTSIPVSAYDILPYGGASSYLPSAELLLPTSAWGTNYMAVLPKDSAGPPWAQLVARDDNTSVQIVPTVPLPQAGPVPAGGSNALLSFTLQAGQYVQWQLPKGSDMSGSVIQADKPVAFTGGNAYICYTSATSNGGGCDSAHQQIPPVSALGFEYVAPPYADRGSLPESIPYRIVGAVDGSTLSYDPPVVGAPSSLNAGQVIDFETVGAFVVVSQDQDHPFYLGQVMSGCNTPGAGGLGDEEFVNILPPAQFLSKYVFFTDPTYPNTNLAVVRKKTETGFKDVTLKCHGTLSGWTPVGAGGEYELTHVDLVKKGQGIGGCSNGPQTASSDGRFGLMVWGLDNYSSYAYPAGGSVAPINTVIVTPIPK
jgi:hypothetical protein